MSTKSSTRKQFKLADKQQCSEYITGLIWISEDILVLVTAAGELVVWQQGKLNFLISPGAYSLDCLGCSGDGKYLAVAGQKGEVQIWQINENSPKLVISNKHKAWIDSLAWCPTENILAYVVNRQIKLWDIGSLSEITSLDFQDSSVFSLAWHPDGSLLAASGHGGVKVWYRQDWQKDPYFLEVPGASLDCKWSDDGIYLASGNLDRTISLLQWDNPPSWLMQGFPSKVSQVTWSHLPSNPKLAAACQEGVTVWQYQQNNWQNYVLEHQQVVKAIAFAPNSSLLASTGNDGNISLWQNQKLSKSLKGTKDGLSCLAWNPTGQYLAAGGQNGELFIYQESTSGKGFSN